ncbi:MULTISPECIES: hypothetical protein [unclassified Sphingopyxis]|uniref:hypothetical protein n=1 Tax=unclassified Sphingopyxis TaxID=2614943 RepID=UPI00285AF956|nr:MULTISPECIES: hypothetical protein [unclassified Sphingopyxis]MDR6831710.1 hypothetical protein [Sphingopyxis sp. BE122]MDR7227452.1 hypothetical protein [Sphingopyxis sp. BE259]
MIFALAALTSSSAIAAEFYHEVDSDGSALILIFGEIQTGDDSKFRELSVRFPEALVGLDSPGGAIVPALEIGRQIRLRGYSTAVTSSSKCTSACALIWLAGTPRFLDPGGSIGFHASYKDQGGQLVETGVGNALVGHYLSQLSLSERAVVFATSASPYEVRWLNNSNRLSSGIEFSVADAQPVRAPRDLGKTTRVAPVAKAAPQPPPPVYAAPLPIPPPVRARARYTAASLRAELSAPQLAETVAAKMALPHSQTKIMAEHIDAMFANESYLERVAAEMNAAGSALSGKNAGAVAFEIAAQLAQKLIYAGLRRLPDADLQRFIAIMGTASLDANVAECGAIFYPSETKSAAQEFQVVGRQGDAALRQYLMIIRKAIFAEVERSPSIVALSPTQAQAGEAAAADEMLRIIDTLPADNQSAVAEAMADMDNANLRDKCAALTVVLTAASTTQGITGNWYRRRFIELSQE